jgi:hypothetical protein
MIYSCSSTNGRDIPDEQSKSVLMSPGELKQKINEQSVKLTSLDSDGDITIDSPEINSGGSITLSAFKPDSIFCRIDGPFGISIARFLITRNNFIYHNVQENLVIKGVSNPVNLGAIIRIKVSFDDLLSGYTNSYFFKDTSSVNSTVIKEKENYLLTVKDSEQVCKYWVNSEYFYIEKYKIYDIKGKEKLEVQYSDFEPEKGIYFPSNVDLTNPAERQNIWIKYGKRVFNNNRLKFKITIPKSAKILEW